jgi:1-acyl-sn-glycerol-3-phosphate acyltransferase
VTPLRVVAAALPRTMRAGRRIAGAGAAAVQAAASLDAIRRRGGDERATRRERALLTRDLLSRIAALHGVEVRVEGPRPVGPVVMASNHVSWLDPIVVGSLTLCVPISKLDVSAWPIVGGFARDLGVLFVDRGDARSGFRVVRGAARALDDGLAVLNFPEGTTTRGDRVLPFRAGLFALARSSGAPVVPVAVSYDPPELAWVGEDAFLPHYLRLAGSIRARATVRFGDAILPRGDQSAAELAAAARARVEELLYGGADAASAA